MVNLKNHHLSLKNLDEPVEGQAQGLGKEISRILNQLAQWQECQPLVLIKKGAEFIEEGLYS